MADDTFAAAVLPRYLAANSGMARVLVGRPRAQIAELLRAWLNTARGRRAILAAEIARALEGAEEGAP